MEERFVCAGQQEVNSSYTGSIERGSHRTSPRAAASMVVKNERPQPERLRPWALEACTGMGRYPAIQTQETKRATVVLKHSVLRYSALISHAPLPKSPSGDARIRRARRAGLLPGSPLQSLHDDHRRRLLGDHQHHRHRQHQRNDCDESQRLGI